MEREAGKITLDDVMSFPKLATVEYWGRLFYLLSPSKVLVEIPNARMHKSQGE